MSNVNEITRRKLGEFQYMYIVNCDLLGFYRFCTWNDLFTCMPLSVVLVYSGEVGTKEEAMSECVGRRHQLPSLERTELNIMCKTVRNKSDISVEE